MDNYINYFIVNPVVIKLVHRPSIFSNSVVHTSSPTEHLTGKKCPYVGGMSVKPSS